MKAFFRKHLGSGRTKKVNVILLCVCGCFILWFFLPLPIYGVLNVGNITGLLVSGACFAIVLFRTPFAGLLRRLWASVPGKVLLLAAAAALVAVLSVAGVLGGKMLAAANRAPQGDETAVVLGCQVKGTGPSLSLSRRIKAAKDYLEAHPDANCVLSGGQGDDEEISEAQCMFNELTNAGIDADRLYLEDRSTSTAENLRFSMEIIERNGLNREIALVTDGYHQCRAAYIAQAYTDRVTAVSAKTPVLLLPTYVLREFYGLLYERLFR